MTILIELEKEAMETQKRLDFYKTIVQNHPTHEETAKIMVSKLTKDLRVLLESIDTLV